MVWLGIKKLGRALRFKRTDAEALGFVENTFVKIADRMGMKTLEMIFPEFDEADRERVEAVFKEYKVKEHSWGVKAVTVTFRENFAPYSVKKIQEIINAVAGYIKEKYPREEPKCQHCGNSANGEVYYTKNESLYLCENCRDEWENKLREEKDAFDRLPEHYFPGLAGALLFAIPGIIVTVLFFVFLQSIAAVSTVLYIFLAKKGYVKFKGKPNQFGALIISFAGVLMTVAGIAVSFVALIVKETKSFERIFEILKIPEVQQEISRNVVSALILSSVFLAINWFTMKKEWSFSELKKAEEI
jgi:hypothetical protein